MKIRNFFTCLFLICCQPVFCQDSTINKIIESGNIATSISIIDQTEMFIDFSKKATLESLENQKFVSVKDYKKGKKSIYDLPLHPVYFRFTVKNNKAEADTLVFTPGYVIKYIDFYVLDSITPKVSKYYTLQTDKGFVDFLIPQNSTKTFYCKAIFNKKKVDCYIYPTLINSNYENEFKNLFYNKRYDIKTFGFVLSGVLLMMILFTFTNYLLSKKIEFLYYSIYSFSVFLIIFFHAFLTRQSGIVSSMFSEYVDFALMLIGTIFYIAFTRRFLDTANKYKTLNTIFKVEERFVSVMFLLYTYLHFCTNAIVIESLLEYSMKIILLTIGVVYIVIAFKQKERLMNYLAIGNALQIVFSCVSLYLVLINFRQTNLFNSAIVYYEVGLAMGLIFFLLGLTYKNKEEIIETTKKQEALKLEAEKQKYETEISVFKAQQEERNRISADMHDDLGAGMTSIRLYSELAKNKLAGQNIPEIEKISSSADELLNKMNAIIWSMTSANDSLENMIAYLRSYAIEYFEDTDIKCTVNLPNELPHAIVSGVIRRNVFLVVKEALHNVLKHANATEVVISLMVEEKIITLYIQDNGKGIDFNNLRQFSNGLKNMKKRMDDVDITFKIENKNGTLVTLVREIMG